MLRIGLVDFDTSHVVAFTQRLNHIDVSETEWVAGAKVVAGCPGESSMMPERIPGYASQLRDYGVNLVAKPADLIPFVDAVMIESQEGAVHLQRARPFLEAAIPTFIDKPLASTIEQADQIITLARQHDTPLISWSALRFDSNVQEAISLTSEYGRLLSADVWSSAGLHPGNPGLLHYGIHGVEILFELLGTGCDAVQTVSNDGGEVTTGLWSDGRIGVLRGLRSEYPGFGFTAHYEKGRISRTIQGAGYYKKSLEQIVATFQSRKAPVDICESREVISFINASTQSISKGGGAEEVQ